MINAELRILRALIDHRDENDGWMFYSEICKATGISQGSSGTVYPALASLIRQGLVERRQDPDPTDGLPPRKQYRAKPDRVPEARQLLAEDDAAERTRKTARRLVPLPSPA
jgi:DNA-binding PadR family transcriptional regulator